MTDRADDRVLWKFLADLDVGLADEIVSGRKPGEVGHSFQIPNDDPHATHRKSCRRT